MEKSNLSSKEFKITVIKVDKPLSSFTKKREDPNKQDKEWKRRNHNWYCRNTKKKQKQNKKLYKNTINNYMTTEEIDKFLETWSPLKLNKEEINNLNRPITRNEIESVIFKNFLQIKVQDQIASQAKSTKELIPIFLKLFQKSEKESTLPKTFYEATITIIPKSDKHYQKRKLQANIFDEFRFKNS